MPFEPGCVSVAARTHSCLCVQTRACVHSRIATKVQIHVQHIWSTFQVLLSASNPQHRWLAVDLMHSVLRGARPKLSTHDLAAIKQAVQTMATAQRDQTYNGSTVAARRTRAAAVALQADAAVWHSLTIQCGLPGMRNVHVHARSGSEECSALAGAPQPALQPGSDAEIQPATTFEQPSRRTHDVSTVDELAEVPRVAQRAPRAPSVASSAGAASRRSVGTARTADAHCAAALRGAHAWCCHARRRHRERVWRLGDQEPRLDRAAAVPACRRRCVAATLAARHRRVCALAIARAGRCARS